MSRRLMSMKSTIKQRKTTSFAFSLRVNVISVLPDDKIRAEKSIGRQLQISGETYLQNVRQAWLELLLRRELYDVVTQPCKVDTFKLNVWWLVEMKLDYRVRSTVKVNVVRTLQNLKRQP